MEVIRAVQDQGGLCLCRESLEKMLSQHRTKTAKFLALGVQLHYHRIILGSNNRLLQKNKLSVDTIKENLIQYFETLDDNKILHPPQVPLPAEKVPVEVVMPQNPTAPNPEVQAPPHKGKGVKRKWYTTLSLEVTEDKEKQRGEEDEEKGGKFEDELELSGNFSQGQRVAVYYNNRFYVGKCSRL